MLNIDPDTLPPDMAVIYNRWLVEEKELKKEAEQNAIDEKIRLQKEIDDQREKDFVDAIEKISRAGYVGKHGEFIVPESEKLKMTSWKCQAKYGDFDRIKSTGNISANVIDTWITLKGISQTEAKQKYIRFANEILTQYGWNPPSGWT